MKKFLALSLFIILAASTAWAQTDEISQIVVRGLVTLKPKVVLREIPLKKGNYYDEQKVRDGVRTLFEQKMFSNIEYDFNDTTGVLTITVEENPYIEKIDFKGNKEFSRSRLTSESVLKKKGYFNQMDLDETIAKITTLYKNKGYMDVQIEVYPTTNPQTGKMTINFLITENQKVSIGGVTIEGEEAFKERKLLRQIKKTKRKKVFNEDLYRADLANLETFYKQRGYMDYELVSSSITYSEDKTKIFIAISIQEGLKYKYAQIETWGNTVMTNEQLYKLTKLKSRQLYKISAINEATQALYEAYADKGYLQAQIGPEFVRHEQAGSEDATVDVIFQIQESYMMYTGNIYIEGLESTREKVIRREIKLNPGDPLSARKVRQSIGRIYNLGFIDAVEPQLLPTRQRDVMDIEFDITEGRPGMISAGVGYSSVDEFVGSVQFQYLNLFGLAQRLNVMAEWGFGASQRRNYQVDWTEPYIFDQNMSLTLSGYQIERIRDYDLIASAYKEQRTGASATVGPRFSDVIFASIGYSFEHVNLDDSIFPRSTYLEQYEYAKFLSDTGISKDNVSSIITSLAYDTRDVYFDPNRGQRQSVTVRTASDLLGGDTNFVKTYFRSSWYFPTFWRFVLGLNLGIGRVVGYGGQDVPIYERYYIGGADTVRGYDYQQIGYTGGAKIMTVFNAEYKFPLLMDRNKTILQGVFFYDIGGAWQDINTVHLELGETENDLRSGVGFGIRFATPMFPLRIDWGYGLNHKRGDKLQKFYFSIGNIF
ncbi:MAG: outer membrane protein assembly factor BamA [Elusimicrobiota bacterium]|jgi:outer membrane protein insertion porin family|nr:outer membrane protein assembly factor BamA [Elusimicrobiota bacterium]